MSENTQRLVADVKTVVDDLEAVIKDLGTSADKKVAALCETAAAKARDLKIRAESMQDKAVVAGKEAARAAEAYAQENPWKAVGIGGAVGLAIGLLLSRR